MDSVTSTTLIDRRDIAQTAADRTNSMAMITDYTSDAHVTRDMLHMHGGHQVVNWLIDGVSISNANIATNLGPQIDPKDIDYLEIQRVS